MKNGNVILIGMPGAGKSTIGVLLAKALMMPFVDTDLVIQQKENRYLQDIINQEGLEKFLSIEEACILNLKIKKHLIATGGSVVYSAASVKHLKDKDGAVVYLELKLEEIEKRLKNISSRGIALRPGESLTELYNERVPLYEKYADIIAECSGKDIEEIVSEIKQMINNFFKKNCK